METSLPKDIRIVTMREANIIAEGYSNSDHDKKADIIAQRY